MWIFLPACVSETSSSMWKLSVSQPQPQWTGDVRRRSWGGPEDWMKTKYTKHSESLLAQSWEPRMLFIIIMLLLETGCQMRNFSWKVKHTFFIHLHTFISKGSIKVISRGRVPLGKIFFWRKKFTTTHVLLMYPCYLLLSITLLLWSAFLPFLLLAFIASFPCYAILKLIQAIVLSYRYVTFRESDLSQSQQQYSAYHKRV